MVDTQLVGLEAAGDSKPIVEKVAKACRILGKLDLTWGAEGHVSFRPDGGDTIFIRGKGPNQVGVRYTRPEDVVEVDFDANCVTRYLEGVREPSEVFLHLWLYKRNPQLRSVIHMHPRHSILLTICDKEILPIHGRSAQGAKLAVEGIRTYPSCITIHDDKLGEAFADFMGDSRVGLMRGHGVTVVGTSVEDATSRAVELNELLKLTYEALAIGGANPLPPGDIEWLKQPQDEDRPRGSAGGNAGLMANWRFLCQMTDEDEA